MNLSTLPQYLTTEQVADILQVSKETVINYVKHKGLPAVQAGRVYRFDPELLKAWIASNQVNNALPLAAGE